jgi:hypothetical protein
MQHNALLIHQNFIVVKSGCYKNQGGEGFLGLCLKTGSSVLVIWASKSLRRFLDLGLKTKWISICRLRHKTDGARSAWDTR